MVVQAGDAMPRLWCRAGHAKTPGHLSMAGGPIYLHGAALALS